jgi:hypothetical protein
MSATAVAAASAWPRDGALSDVEAELHELPMDSWGAPEWVGTRHSGDQRLELGIDGRATSGGPSRELGPVLSKATPLPPQDGVGRHGDESLSPAGPDSGQADPHQTIHRAKLRAGQGSLVDGKLLAEGEVLERELIELKGWLHQGRLINHLAAA